MFRKQDQAQSPEQSAIAVKLMDQKYAGMNRIGNARAGDPAGGSHLSSGLSFASSSFNNTGHFVRDKKHSQHAELDVQSSSE